MASIRFTAEDLEEILWAGREDIELRLIEDGQVAPSAAGRPWSVGLAYVDRLVLAVLTCLPDQAPPPRDSAPALLLRYILMLVDKRDPLGSAGCSALQLYDRVRRELQQWEQRIRPLIVPASPASWPTRREPALSVVEL